jgi:prevent-host-death family protein
MITVGATEFRAHIYRYVAAVERGDVVVLTRRGKPVARFRPYDPDRDPAPEGGDTVVAVLEGLDGASD